MKRILLGVLSLALLLALPLHVTPASAQAKQATAVFAGGCFWCLESDMDKVKGVLSTTSGYTGGTVANPTYEQVSAGSTGHAESVKVVYDPSVVTYKELLHVFWRNVDPVTADAQFCDHGSQYRAAIFYGNDEEKQLAEASKAELKGRFKQPVVTQIVPASTFYPAEDYHQDYYKKNPVKYKFYRLSCGRDRRLKELWGNEAGAHSS
ncbi:MAG: methionine-S-sulfoxide reductase [Hyphomicrobiales bacterium]|nr:methionine-S-sulfoxide reductase [Hyphomicrobiales bacterium]